MTLDIRVRPKAEQDLQDIWSYTSAERSEDQAVAYLEGFEATAKLLAEFPEMARLRDNFTPPVRIHPFRAHVIIYLHDDRCLEIVRVSLARSNWNSVLSE